VRPRYLVIKEHISELIDSGQWKVGRRTPSDNQIAEQFGVSRMTANRALKELTDAGLLKRVAGVGTFVAEQIPQAPLFEIKNIADEIRSRGHQYSGRPQQLVHLPATRDIALELEIAADTTVFHSLVVHCENDIPVQLEERYVNPALVPHYIEQDFSLVTSNEYLSEVLPCTAAEHIIEATLPDKRTQQLLDIEPDQPCLLLRRRTWSGSDIACMARLTHPSNRYRLGGHFIPSSKPAGLHAQVSNQGQSFAQRTF
jgi:GntR family histidine utilization transcriptional repressor